MDEEQFSIGNERQTINQANAAAAETARLSVAMM